MHEVYELRTQHGHYAVKLLQPQIMKRPRAAENFKTAEAAEARADIHGLPVLASIPFQDQKMQFCAGRYYYLFPFFEGKALTREEITTEHILKVAGFLRELHSIPAEFETQPAYCVPELRADFPKLLLDKDEYELLSAFICLQPKIWTWNYRARLHAGKLCGRTALCHHDLDTKNILWNAQEFRVIDLECMGPGDPLLEASDAALNWCGYDDGCGDIDQLLAFWDSYLGSSHQAIPDFESLLWCRTQLLDWLNYNMCRALGQEGEAFISLGKEQSFQTMRQIHALYDAYPSILASLEKHFR